MTDIQSAHKALIEAALDAEGLMHEPAPRAIVRLREALDAYRALDPTGSTLARWAAIGEAVERLGGLRAVSLRAERILDKDEWAVVLRWWPAPGPPPHHPIDRTGTGPTLPAAISAALREP